jgi:hypothetical protein
MDKREKSWVKKASGVVVFPLPLFGGPVVKTEGEIVFNTLLLCITVDCSILLSTSHEIRPKEFVGFLLHSKQSGIEKCSSFRRALPVL